MKTDLVILGGGPAGLTAGLYASRARVPVIVIEKGLPGGQLTATETVDNYPGFSEPILGVELAQKMEAQARKFGVEIIQADVRLVTPTDEGFSITARGEQHFCRSSIDFGHRRVAGKIGHSRRIEAGRKGSELLRGMRWSLLQGFGSRRSGRR